MIAKSFFSVLVVFLLVFGGTASPNGNEVDGNTGSSGHKIGLVLSGGGAKGAVHIGVMRQLEKSGIHIDYIAGTSIGAIIGSLYAVGYDVDFIERQIISQDWESLMDGDGLESHLESLFADKNCKYFSDTRIPFRCVATDTRDGLKEVVLSHGQLAKAVRASMSVPLVYKRIEIDGMLLMDGGLMNNLPVDVARSMGADIIIAVDLDKGRDKDFQFLLSNYGIESDVDWVFSRPDKKKHKVNSLDADFYINPNLNGYSSISFNPAKCREMVDLGERAARNYIANIKSSIGQ